MTDAPRTRRTRRSSTSVTAPAPDTASGTAGPPPAPAFAPTVDASAAPTDSGAAWAFGPRGSRTVGGDTARPSLDAARAGMRPLQRFGDVLPELEDAQEPRRRPLWRHPASIVSAATTLVALITFVVLLLLGFFAPQATASGLRLEVTDNVVRATWTGDAVPYQAIVVDGPSGTDLDVSQRVTGTELWLPLAALVVDDGSCIVVRPVAGNEEAAVALDRATLDAQRADAACVADALRAAEDAEQDDAEQ